MIRNAKSPNFQAQRAAAFSNELLIQDSRVALLAVASRRLITPADPMGELYQRPGVATFRLQSVRSRVG
jgi:hypothetical protein